MPNLLPLPVKHPLLKTKATIQPLRHQGTKITEFFNPSVLCIPKASGTASTVFLAMLSSFSDKGAKLIPARFGVSEFGNLPERERWRAGLGLPC